MSGDFQTPLVPRKIRNRFLVHWWLYLGTATTLIGIYYSSPTGIAPLASYYSLPPLVIDLFFMIAALLPGVIFFLIFRGEWQRQAELLRNGIMIEGNVRKSEHIKAGRYGAFYITVDFKYRGKTHQTVIRRTGDDSALEEGKKVRVFVNDSNPASAIVYEDSAYRFIEYGK